MKMQALMCEADNHPWQRPSQRGRKPRLCPEHHLDPHNPIDLMAAPPRSVPVSVVEGSETGDPLPEDEYPIICHVDPDYDETDDLTPFSELDPTTAGQRRAAMLDDRLKARGQHISQH